MVVPTPTKFSRWPLQAAGQSFLSAIAGSNVEELRQRERARDARYGPSLRFRVAARVSAVCCIQPGIVGSAPAAIATDQPGADVNAVGHDCVLTAMLRRSSSDSPASRLPPPGSLPLHYSRFAA